MTIIDKIGSYLSGVWLSFSLITIVDFVDIAIIAILLYQLIKFVRGTGAERLLKGLVVLLALSWIVSSLKLQVLSWLLSGLITVGPIAIVVLFQPELRKLLERFGRTRFSFFRMRVTDRATTEKAIGQVIDAVNAMSRSRTGALIVFEKNDPLTPIVGTGTTINADVNAELIKNIFYNKAPLHDGAMVIVDARIEAAGCILPLSSSLDMSKELGTRHRAALGLSESYDGVTVVVSEETGAISFCSGGILKRHLAPETLERLLINELLPALPEEREKQTLWQRLKGGRSQ